MAEELVQVASDDDAISLLANFLEDPAFIENVNVEFVDWPILTMRMSGERFKGGLTPRTMKSALALQQQVDQSYALAVHNTSATNKLTEIERESNCSWFSTPSPEALCSH